MPTPPSVRLAMPADVPALVAVQRAWMAADPVMAPVLEDLTEATMQTSWMQAISRPPLATYRVLVAREEDATVGFAAVGPSEDEDAEPTDGTIALMCVHPEADRSHLDRLMHAAVDTLRADGFERATWWITSTDDATRAVLVEAGWAPDGAFQEIGDDHTRVKQIRLHTLIADPAQA